VFFVGVIVGLALAVAAAWWRQRRAPQAVISLERTVSAQFRKITELEHELAEAKAGAAQAVRNEKLRNAREFKQYKKLLRRADTALAQAKAERAASVLEAA